MADLVKLQELCTQVRRDILRMVFEVQSGHPGGSLGCTEYFVALYFAILKHRKRFNLEGKGEDLFFLSNGHISPVWYSVLARSGYFPVAELSTFRKINSRLQGHPTTHEGLPGIRIASGSLGQGLSAAIGAALAKRMDGEHERRVFCLTGDGELQEGQCWEAIMFAAHHKVDNLIVAVDWNGQQIDGPTHQVMSLDSLPAKWKAFGWDVLILENGNDLRSVIDILRRAKRRGHRGKPVVILMKTRMGYGIDFMVDTHKWHGKAPNAEQFEVAMAQLPETSFGDY